MIFLYQLNTQAESRAIYTNYVKIIFNKKNAELTYIVRHIQKNWYFFRQIYILFKKMLLCLMHAFIFIVQTSASCSHKLADFIWHEKSICSLSSKR